MVRESMESVSVVTKPIKLPMSITDARTMLSFSTVRELYHKKYLINGLLFLDHILKFNDFFST